MSLRGQCLVEIVLLLLSATSAAGPALPSHKEASRWATDGPAEPSPSVPGVGSEGVDVALLGASTDSAEGTLTPPTTTPQAAGVIDVVQTSSSDVPGTLPPSSSGEPALLEYRSIGRVDALQSSEVAAPSEEPLETGGGSGRSFTRDQSAVLAAEAPRSGRGKNGQLPEYDFDNPSSGGTNVYIIAIIGLVPAAGAVIWCVRKALSKGEKGEVPATAPAEDKESGHETPTKYAYVQEAYNREYGKVISQLVATAPRRSSPDPPGPEEFPRSCVRLEKVLGEGNFGRVWKATAVDPGGPARTVAVKTLKEYANNDEKRDLIREMQVMRELGKHPNVVEFLGCCTRDEPLLLIMELVSRGKLLGFLREHRARGAYYNSPEGDGALGPRDLAQFAQQVSQGMHYIGSRGIIHRDLAARNVLVDEHGCCKVADFGLSRSIRDSETDVYHQKSKGALPVRWMAPECLYLQVFTFKSDVWAFGILLWEIVTLGSTPYPGLGAQEVIRHVRDGHVMTQPTHCRWELYRLMRSCWNPNPNERPSFEQLSSDLDSLIKLNAGYIDLDNFPEHAYCNVYYGVDEKL